MPRSTHLSASGLPDSVTSLAVAPPSACTLHTAVYSNAVQPGRAQRVQRSIVSMCLASSTANRSTSAESLVPLMRTAAPRTSRFTSLHG